MKARSQENGQALILIVFAIIGLVGVTGLVVDGGMAYSDRRQAQNGADDAALAAALAFTRGGNVHTTAMTAANSAGFSNDGVTNTVTESHVATAECPFSAPGQDITVQITSHVKTSFAPVVGIREVTNTVQAVTRACGTFIAPPFPGNAIVALGGSGIGFDAAGTPDWRVENGGIFSNSSSTPSARCKGAADVTAPSLTTVGGAAAQCSANIGVTTSGVPQYTPEQWASLMPRTPTCNGTANLVGGSYQQESGKDGSKVAFNGDMDFRPGLYCVTNSPGPYHGTITGTGVTFYIMSSTFSMKFNGGGNLTATAPSQGDFAGVLMFSAPQFSGGVLQDTQSIDLRGNGIGAISGSVLMPSASVTMFGNSSGAGMDTMVVAYNVDSGGNSNIYVNYNAGRNYQSSHPAWLSLLK